MSWAKFFHTCSSLQLSPLQRSLLCIKMFSPNENDSPWVRQTYFLKAVDAIKNNDFEGLKDILNFLREFSTFVDQEGRNLLHLSCHHNRVNMFEFLLALKCFDLEALDYTGKTVLHEALDRKSDCFSVKIIKAGFNIHRFSTCNTPLLHYAVRYDLFQTTKLLIERGIDLNVQDKDRCTLLLAFMKVGGELDERMSWFLENGADATICDDRGYSTFDWAVFNNRPMSLIEHLFYYTYDSHSDYVMPSRILETLLTHKLCCPHFLDDVIEITSEVYYEDDWFHPSFLFTMRPHILKKLIERSSSFVKHVLSTYKAVCTFSDSLIKIENFEILLNSELRPETVDFISKVNLDNAFSRRQYCGIPIEETSDLFFYLLSHGLNICTSDYRYVYETAGYCDLFKAMLHLKSIGDASHCDEPMVRIMVDIHCDLNTVLGRFDFFSRSSIELLLDYFANYELRVLCVRTGKPALINKLEQLPTVPSLLQLARDVLRRHIVRRYKLQKTSQYYWVLSRLGIATAHEKILSFETKLYE